MSTPIPGRPLADMSVRPALPGDENAIASLQWEAWVNALGEDRLREQGATLEKVAAQWRATLTHVRPASVALVVALHGNRIVGFAFAGPDEAPPASSETPDLAGSQRGGGASGEKPATQIYELVVDHRFTRSGHGSRLLSALADLTSGELLTWISAGDEARQRFYSSSGFAPQGAQRTLGEGLTQHLWWASRS